MQETRGRRFRYRASDAAGTLTDGVLVAEGASEARAALHRRSLVPISLSLEESASGASRIGAADLALGARVLADLLDSGIPVSRAVELLDDLAPDSWRAPLARVRERVRAGASLSEALAGAEDAIPAAMVGMVRAGEIGSGLSAALRSAASLYEEHAATRAALLSALTYPAILLTACIGSVALLSGVVLPRFAELLRDLGQQVPPTTAFLLAVSHTAGRLAPAIAILAIAATIAAWRVTATAESRARWHALLLGAPIVGPIRHAIGSANLCATAAALIASGVPLPVALQQAAMACGDDGVGARVRAARGDVLAGARLSRALQTHRALTSVCVKLVAAGEESGTLAPMLERASRIERSRAQRRIKTATQLIEPALVIGFGAIVALVAGSLLQAVYAVRPLP